MNTATASPSMAELMWLVPYMIAGKDKAARTVYGISGSGRAGNSSGSDLENFYFYYSAAEQQLFFYPVCIVFVLYDWKDVGIYVGSFSV